MPARFLDLLNPVGRIVLVPEIGDENGRGGRLTLDEDARDEDGREQGQQDPPDSRAGTPLRQDTNSISGRHDCLSAARCKGEEEQ
jgi:hypothetical protein